ncbi:hydroxycarboxylic acid receptor 2-like [Centroberyx affinis]|uniref:hydroxycarboxylic acid receptor 2-like n=1 Tax=Centroberyx affinis TaxID=166261 RepID=UPI003A5C72B6
MLPELSSNFTTMMPDFTTRPPAGDCQSQLGDHLEYLKLPAILTSVVIVVLGLLGNAVALWIFCFRLKTWNPNNLFLFNLVIADFLVLVSVPLNIDALIRGHWMFGDGLCHINLFLMFANRSASIGLMTVVAIYRYFKVVHPHHWFNRMNKKQAGFVAAFLWLLMIGPWVPMLVYNHIQNSGNNTQCRFFTSYSESSRAIIILVGMHRILSVLEFFIPLAMLLFCSARISCILRRRQMDKSQKVRRAMRVCAVIVGVFVVCFLPGTLTTIGLWIIRSYRSWDCDLFNTFTKLTIVSLGLNFLNSALDPVIYCFSSSMFRKALCSLLPAALRCGQEVSDGEAAASSSGTQSMMQQEP